MTDRPSAPQPVAGVVLDRDGLPTLVVRGNEDHHVAHAGAGRVYSQAALDAAVAAARAEERERFVALCERAVRDFVNPGSELPYDHGFVSACNVLKQASIRAATPQDHVPEARFGKITTQEPT